MSRLAMILLWVILLSACGSPPAAVDPAAMERLTRQSGLTLPESAKVAFEERGERPAAEGYGMWIVSAPQELKMQGEPLAVPSATVRKVLETHLSSATLGESAAGDARSYRWTNGNSDWRASVLQTSTGWHAVIERSKM